MLETMLKGLTDSVMIGSSPGYNHATVFGHLPSMLYSFVVLYVVLIQS
jgi:hypothetical protein